MALGARWAYLAPLAAALGGLALIFGDHAPAIALLAVGSAVFVLASCDVMRRQPQMHNACLVLGATGWLAGNLLLATGVAVPSASPAWIGFLVLTIAGERLELSRFMPPSANAKRIFVVIASLLPVALLAGWQATGGCLLALAVWLARNDVALRTIRGKGLARYIAACLLAGYAWLALGAAIMLAAAGMQPGQLAHDAALHAVFLGFVFSMVFGHAPIIVPAVFRVALPYHPLFYLPLVVLHATLAFRVAADAAGIGEWRAFAGAGNAVAIGVFIATMLAAVAREKLRGSNSPGKPRQARTS